MSGATVFLVSRNERNINLINCTEHVDKNYDMLCDICLQELPLTSYLQNKSVESVLQDNSKVLVSGSMLEDTSVETKEIAKEDAVSMAKKYIPEITSGEVLCAYDISMISNTKEYQPGDYNQVVKVNISNLDLDIKDTVALLHIIDEENYEILPLSKASNSELEFKATRFSPYILIYVDTYKVSFSGDENFEIFDINGNEILSGDTFNETKLENEVLVPAGTNFNFVIVPKKGYGIGEVSLVDAAEESSGDNYLTVSGNVKGKAGKINKVLQDLEINVETVLAPKITKEPTGVKVQENSTAKFTITAENATSFTWQYRENENTYWKDIVSTIGSSSVSGTTSTFTASAVPSITGYEFRCLVGNTYFTNDERIKSDAAIISVVQGEITAGETPVILSQTEGKKIKLYNGSAKFEVLALGTDLSFTWQYRENENTYWKEVTSSTIGSVNTSVPSDSTTDRPLKKSVLTTSMSTYSASGYEFRCLVGNNFYKSDNAVKSNIFVLSVVDDEYETNAKYFELDFVSEPVSQKIHLGETATYKVQASGADTYLWQYRNMLEDVDWTDVTSDIGTGFTTNTLSVDTSNVSLDENTLGLSNNLSGYEFRCLIVNSEIETYQKASQSAYLSIAQDTISTEIMGQLPEINFTATPVANKAEIDLAWDMTDGVIYSIYYINDNGENELVKSNVKSPYKHSNLKYNTTYEYTIVGVDLNNSSYLEKETCVATTDSDPISKDDVKPEITNVSVTPSSGTITPNSQVTIKFDFIDDNYDYLNGSLLYPEDVIVLVNGLETSTANKTLTKETITSGERFTLTITNIWGEGDVSIKISKDKIFDLALNGNDEEIITTNLVAVRNLVKAVTNFNATSGDYENSIVLSWRDTENTGTIKYVIEATKDANNWVTLGETNKSTYTHSGLSKNMSFEYRIKAVDSLNNESEYVYETGRTKYDPTYTDIMIDETKPVIKLVSINPEVDYVGSSQTISLVFEATDDNYNSNFTSLLNSNFTVKVAGNPIEGVEKTLTKASISKGENFTLTLSNITSSGKLSILIASGVVKDSALNVNDEIEIDTGILVKNGDTITNDKPTLVPDVHSISVTNNQISTIPIEKIIYEYKMTGDENFTSIESTSNSITISGLYSNTMYEVRTLVIDVAGNEMYSEIATTTTKKIDASAIKITHESKEWTNLVSPKPEVIATILWNDTKYNHQYSLDNTNWNMAGETATNINITKNVTIYARYTDGVGYSDSIEYKITNIDLEKPTIENVTIPSGKANTKQITVSGIKDTGGSGIKGYYVSKIADLSLAEWTNLSESSFKFTVSDSDSYYIWVIDNAGNISEAKIATVQDIVTKVSNVTLDSEITVKVFEKKTPTLTYDGEPKSIKWEIEDSTLASIDETTGTVTGKTAGETVIKVTITDYDGTITIIECKLIVEPAESSLKVNEPKEFTFVYGASASETTFTYDGTGTLSVSALNGNIASAEIVDNRIIITPGDAGETMVVISAEETEEYAGVSVNIPVTVTKRAVKLTWDKDSFEYDGKQKEVVASVENTAYSDVISITAKNSTATVVGTYTAEAIKIVGTKAKNYTLENGENLTHDWEITKAERTVTGVPDSVNVIYNKETKINFTYVGEDTTASLVQGDTNILNASLTDGERAGTITLNAVRSGNTTITLVIPATDNYNEYRKEISVITYPSDEGIKVDVPNFTLTYGESTVSTGYTYNGDGEITITSSNSNVVSASINEAQKTIEITPINVSENTVTITIKTTDTPTYSASETKITVKVNPRVVVLSWYGTSFEYDGTEKEVTAVVDNLVGTDEPGIQYENNKKTNAGNYVAKVTKLTNTNYTLTGAKNTSHNWEITKADISPILKMEGYVYGGKKSTPVIENNFGGGEETFYVYNVNSGAEIINWKNVDSSYYLEPGTYEMYATVGATTNYNSATTNTVSFVITKKDISVELFVDSNTYDGSWTNKNIVAKITVPEEITNMESVYCKVGEDGKYEAYVNTSKTGNVVTITFDKNINSKVYFVAVNAKGNALSNESTACLIKLDKDKPTIGNVTVTPEGVSNSKTIEVTNIEDTGESGIYGYYIGKETDISKLTWTKLDKDNFTDKVYENGTYYIVVRDNAGNISDATTIKVVSLVEKITNAKVDQNLEVEVFKSISSGLTFSGDASEIIYTFENPDIATADPETGVITAKNAGETKVIITIKNYDGDLEPTVLETTLKVTKRKVDLTWTGKVFTYDGTIKKVTATVTGARAQDNVYVSKYTDNEKIDAGEYTAVAEELNDNNYTLEGATNQNYNWKIIQATIEPQLVMYDYAYGGTKATPKIIGNVENGKVTYYVYKNGEDIGTKINWDLVTSSTYLEPGVYKMYAEIAATENYEAAVTSEETFEISIKNVIVELTKEGVPYDGSWSNKNIVATITVPEDVTGMTDVYYKLENESEWKSNPKASINGNVVTMTFENSVDSKISFVGVNTKGEHITTESTMYRIKIDKIKPVIGNIVITPENTVVSNRKTIEAQNIVDEGGSGLAYYYIGLESNLSNMTWQVLNTNKITLDVTEVETYNVIVKDAAGNLSDMYEVGVQNIVEKISDITIPSEIQLEVFEKKTPDLTYTGEPESITWEILDDTIAKINETTGEITGVSSGETIAKVTLVDYDGTKTEVSIKVIIKATTPVFDIDDANIFTFVYGDGPKQAKLNYSGDADLIITVDDESVVTVEILGDRIKVTPTGRGATNVKITAEETKRYEKLEKEFIATVSQRPVELTWTDSNFYYDGEEKEVIASVKNVVGNDDVRIVKYQNNKKLDAGTYIAIAEELNNDNYTLVGGTNIENEWIINKADRELTLSKYEINIPYGEFKTVDFSYLGEVANMTAISNNTDIATGIVPTENMTTGSIQIDAIGRGTATIKVKVDESQNYNTAEKDVKVNVIGVTPTLTVYHPEITITYGDAPTSTTYVYTGNASQDSMTVTSENEYVAEATVTGNQVVITPTGAGRTKIILTAPGTNQYSETSTEIVIIVKKRPVELTWSGEQFVYDGKEKEVTAIVNNLVGNDMVEISYSGNKETNAGTYTAEAIKIIGDRGNHYTVEGGTNITHEFEILKGDREVTIDDKVTLEYSIDKTINFSYNGEDVTATIQVTDENIAKATCKDLENSGKITLKAVSSGETTLLVTLPESKNFSEKTVSVSVIVKPTSANLQVVEDELKFIYGGANQNVKFTAPEGVELKVESLDENIATATIVGDKISVAPKGVGTTTITLSSSTTNQYLADSITINVTVDKRPVILDWGSRNFNYDGSTKTITATVTNAVLGDTVIVEEYENNSAVEIGTYYAKATKLSNSNYTLVGGKNIETEWVIGVLTPPDIIVRQDGVNIPSGTWASGDVTVEVQPINGAGSDIGYEYSYDGIKWYEYKGIFTYKEETIGQKIYSRAYSKITGVSAAENGEYLLRLDKTDPEITIESINATNVVEGIINKNATITLRVNIKDDYSGIENDEFTLDDIRVLAIYKGETKEVFDVVKTLVEDTSNQNKERGTYSYTITLSNITENGRLAIRFNEKAVNDRATRYNKQKTLNLNLVADNKGPEIDIIQTSADEYNRIFSDILELEVGARDESGIAYYEWQVSDDGVNWKTFVKDVTSAELSETTYNSVDSGVHHFRVIVTDIIGNSSISDIVSININLVLNRKPTIRFETSQTTGARVNITIIVKSTKQIESIKLNASEIDKSKWNTIKTNNEITITTDHVAVSNGTYSCTVLDEAGNEVTETLNITTIDTNSAIITYDTYNATEYSQAMIKFKASEDVRISKVIDVSGSTKKIINKTDYTGMRFDTVDFSSNINVQLENITFEKGTTFVFENKSFIETYVVVDKDIETKIMYVRSTSDETLKFFDELFGDAFTIDKAEVLINNMMAKTKVIYGKVTAYYGISDSAVKFKLTDSDELRAVSYLAAETNTGDTLRINEYGDVEKLKPTISRNIGGDNMTYTNSNITGIKVFGNILDWTGSAIKNSFRITIRAR